ncbi:hypothetical protein OIO90_004947 [Microbotryomycetes sp. JL221]|nr:hypothetical protein OIO90_004947 [Microbotryomycetes sp. JL221]
MSFYQHLRRLSSPQRAPGSNASTASTVKASPALNTNVATPATVASRRAVKDSSPIKKTPASTASANSRHASHVLSFSNRISLSVRTPPYTFKSYVFFSIVVMTPTNLSPARAGTTKKRKSGSTASDHSALKSIGPHSEVFIGAFGRWYAWRRDGDELDEEERRGRVSRGVLSMEAEIEEHKESDVVPTPTINTAISSANTAGAVAEADDSPDTSTPSPTSPTTKTSSSSVRQSRNGKRVMKAGQRRASPNSLARLRTKAAEAASAASSAINSTNASGASSVCATPGVEDEVANGNGFFRKRATSASGSKQETTKSTHTKSGSGSGSAVSAGTAAANVNKEQTSSSLTTLVSDVDDTHEVLRVDESDPVLVELRMQVDELKAASRENERRLQEELEILRAKKKEEDATRAELKAKTRELEDHKRDTDLLKIEAERELNERKGKVREAQDRVEKLRGEIKKIDKREHELIERREKKKRDRKERERKLREDVGKKKDELKKAQSGIEQLMNKVSEMERTLDQRREVLQAKRNDQAARRMGFGMVGNPNGGMSMPDHRVVSAPLPNGGPAHGRMPPIYAPIHPSSRPGSIRSGYANRFDTSAPSSPTVARPIGPYQDSFAPYGEQPEAHMGSGFGPAPYAPHPAVAAPSTGFLEHRLQHRRAELESLSQPHAIVSTLPSSNDIPTSFKPFSIDSTDHSPIGGLSSTRPSSLYDETTGQRRPQLALPLQYLESGLLETADSPGLDGPLSPMTPHQTSLIPSQLFQMLDEDDDDDQFVMPDSPTLHGQSDMSKGLGLDVDDEIKRPSTSTAISNKQQASKIGTDGTIKSPVALLSPISPVSPTSPVSATSENSTPGFHRATPFAPWDGGDVLLSSTRQPLSDHTGYNVVNKDDMPRAGLSLNPDAKAFASQLPSSSSSSAVGLIRGVTRSSHSSSPSSDSAHSPLVADSPAKSRMEFSSTRSMSSPLGLPAGAEVKFNPFGDA